MANATFDHRIIPPEGFSPINRYWVRLSYGLIQGLPWVSANRNPATVRSTKASIMIQSPVGPATLLPNSRQCKPPQIKA